MAKRSTGKPAPDDGAQHSSAQIPEGSFAKPNPWDEIAASAQHTPLELTAGLVKPRTKPDLVAPLEDFDPDAAQRKRANQSDPSLTIYRPARGRMSVLGTDLMGNCAVKNELGHREPTRAVISKSTDRKWFFIMPTHHKAGKSVEITYQDKQACINLFAPFDEMGKLVPKGYRQSFYLEITDEPMTIQGITGYALYFSLTEYKEEAISPREEAEGAPPAPEKKSSKAKGSKKSPDAPSTPTAEAAEAAPSAVAGTPNEEHGALLVQELNEMINSRDAEIEEIKAQLKAYKERFGQLE